MTSFVSKMNTKSRPSTKYKKLSKQNKFIPGEFIYDTKGQKAEIKYIGECHKGPGTWFGIQYVDGTLSKHNGTINGKTYFEGAPKRCDMIRVDKIRRKTTNQTSVYQRNRFVRKRATSDISQMESVSLTNLSLTATKKTKPKHKRMTSQPSKLCNVTSTVNDLYFDARRKDRNTLLFGNKSRGEKVLNGEYADICAKYESNRVHKERYRGNKYLLAMREETERRKHKRVDSIKSCKKRVQKQKHVRNSSKIQQILKRKEAQKEEMMRLMEQNKLKELQRIKAAKQKSRRRLIKNDVKYIESHNNVDNKRMHTNSSVDIDGMLKNDFIADTLRLPAANPVLVTPYSDSDVLDMNHMMPSKPPSKFAIDSMFPSVSSDSALLLKEMLDQPMSELVSSEDECASQDSVFIAESNDEKAIRMQAISECAHLIIELPEAKTRESEFYFPISSGYKSKSDALPKKLPTLKRAESAPIITNEDKGTDYWIKQYNKANKKRKLKAKKKKKTPKTPKLSIINPKHCANVQSAKQAASLSPYDSNYSPFICDNISDIVSLCSSTRSLDFSPSPPASGASTPNTPNLGYDIQVNDSDANVTQSTYGGYPFARKREAYINKRFTGITRVGHRYLLRDGRVGVARYINNTRFGVGTWIGFELDKAEGEHNGSVNDVKYFECDAMHGAFVKKSQIAQYIARDTTKSLSKHQLRSLNIVT